MLIDTGIDLMGDRQRPGHELVLRRARPGPGRTDLQSSAALRHPSPAKFDLVTIELGIDPRRLDLIRQSTTAPRVSIIAGIADAGVATLRAFEAGASAS
jgi:hypothetical protein